MPHEVQPHGSPDAGLGPGLARVPKNKRALVVGAGVSGLATAVLLARRGVDVEVWEASSEPGGLLAPVEFSGKPCDRGSHRVHPSSHPLLRELTEAEGWLSQPRNGKLVLNGRQITYPIDPVSFMRGLGARTVASMGLSWLRRPQMWRSFRSWERDRSDASVSDAGFEDFVLSRAGRAAYEQFYRPYVEKVWGEDANRISQSVAKQRVSTSDPHKTILRSLGLRDDKFLYPRTGMAGLVRHLSTQAENLGATLYYERPFKPAHLQNGKHGHPSDGRGFDAIFYTAHLSDLVPGSQLHHRGLYLLHLALPRHAIDPTVDTWYLPESKFWFSRVSQPASFSPEFADARSAILCLEIPEGRLGRKRDFEQQLPSVLTQLVEARILRSPATPAAFRQTFLPRIYPNYYRDWYHTWSAALRHVQQLKRVLPLGRQGLFLHCNIDHCVEMADDAVRHFLSGEAIGAWIDRAGRYQDLRVRD
ncbi:MAG: FAD-dependent oxidoreductase [Myxococcales bacterium]|nr:FAD-dependent oxidoreductase [Myxococcales bacterium]